MLPGGGEGAILGGKLKTGWGGVGVQGLVTQRARVETPGLEGLKASGAGGDNVAWLAAVGAEVGISPAATFFMGEVATGPTHTVQLHGNRGLGRGEGKAGGWGRGGWRTIGLTGLGWLLAAGEVGRGLVLLDGDGGCDVVLE